MKLLLLLLLPTVTLFGQKSTEIGNYETFDGEKVMIYNYPTKKKINLSAMDKGCDCMLQKLKVFYFNDEGQLMKVEQSKVKKLTLNEGATYCQKMSKTMPGGDKFEHTLPIELPESMSFLGLPAKKSGKSVVLQSVLATSDGHLLTLFTNDAGNGFVYIYTEANHQYVDGGFHYEGIGYGKAGERAHGKIKQLFKSCTALLESMDQIHKENKKAKGFQKRYLLQEAATVACD